MKERRANAHVLYHFWPEFFLPSINMTASQMLVTNMYPPSSTARLSTDLLLFTD